MNRAGGYAVWVTDGRVEREADTVTCCHCGGVVLLHDAVGSARENVVGYCSLCDAKTCASCAAKRECKPFEKKLNILEARSALLRELGVGG